MIRTEAQPSCEESVPTTWPKAVLLSERRTTKMCGSCNMLRDTTLMPACRNYSRASACAAMCPTSRGRRTQIHQHLCIMQTACLAKNAKLGAAAMCVCRAGMYGNRRQELQGGQDVTTKAWLKQLHTCGLQDMLTFQNPWLRMEVVILRGAGTRAR